MRRADESTAADVAHARDRRGAWMALEFPGILEFDDPALEWRRLFSEFLGTFMLILVGAGGAVVGAVSHGMISRAAAVTAPGLMVMAVILFMGAISGAHLNPAVTIAFTLRGDFPWRRVPGYIIVQLAGAALACLFLRAVFGNVGRLGATVPGAHIHDWQALLIELALTVGLVSTILGTASRAQNVGALSALGVGGYIILAGLWSSPVSGASMNPARSFGPDLVNGDFTHYWVYLAGPLAGAALAVAFAWILRGPGDVGGMAAARGLLDPTVRDAIHATTPEAKPPST
ncbi:MAG TPA: aquaporin [Solirubrobacteraceae bacterium]|nr:aquaporin [Solirubrobacteraceae bacterium]